MKLELTLKHLVGYLPYGLKCQIKDLIKDDEENKIKKLSGIQYDGLALLGNGGMFGFYQRSFKDIKPILHPLSDLTKHCEDLGFVPIERLKELYYPTNQIENGGVLIEELVFINGEFKNYFQDYHYIGDGEHKYYKSIGYNESVNIYTQLYEWKFDIHGLIENGLAIDINTIEL